MAKEEYTDDLPSEDALTLEAAWEGAELIHAALERAARIATKMGQPDVAAAIRESEETQP